MQDTQIFYIGSIFNRRVVMVRCGMGKVNASICAMLMIKIFAVKSILLVGLAGALADTVQPGDVLVATDVIQHDVDATGLGYAPGELPDLHMRSLPVDPDLAQITLNASDGVIGLSTLRGRILSGDQFVSTPSFCQFLRTLFNGDCADMESGAVGQVCVNFRVPFLSIQFINRNCSSTEPSQAKNITRLAVETMATMLLNILSNVVQVPGS